MIKIQKIGLIILCALMGTRAFSQPGFQLPVYEKFKLKNGLTIFLMEQHEVPLINVSAIFEAGSINDGENYGLASLTADALLFGTQKYTKAQIEELTDFAGANLQTYAGKDGARVASSFAAKDQDKMFDIIRQILMYPVFDAKEFEKHKQRTLLQLAQEKESPNAVIWKYYNKFLFGNFPYATTGSGTRSTVQKITPALVSTFYKSHYTADKGAIAVVGDFKTQEMKSKLTALFDNWKTAESRMIKRAAPDLDFEKSRILLVNKADARETTIAIGGKGIDYSNPDYIPVLVVNTILGGRFTSWLNDALRVNSGLTYGARSFFSRNKYAGTFAISTFTKNASTEAVIDLALGVLDSLHRKGIDETTLLSAKSYVKGDFPTDYEAGGSLAALLTDMHLYNFDESFINTFQEKVDSLTADRVREIVTSYFPKDRLQFVMIGKADEIRPLLKKYGELTEKQVKAEGY
jgi:zinc protease